MRISDKEEIEIQKLVHDTFMTVGKLTQNSGLADLYLFMVFRHLAGCSPEEADAIYFALDAHSAKANIVHRLARLRKSPQINAAVTSMLGAVKNAHRPRNGLAHSVVAFDNAGRPQIRNPKAGKPTPITTNILNSAMRQSGDAIQSVQAAFLVVCPLIGLVPHLAADSF